MRGVLWIIALFVSAVALALLAQNNNGYVLVVLPPWRVELTFNLFLCLIVGGLLLAYLSVRTLALLFGLSGKVRRFRERRQRHRASEIFEDAVRLLFEGRYGQALKKSEKAHTTGLAPSLSALIAARASQRLRNNDKLQYWIEQAREVDPSSEAATLMLEAESCLEARQYDDCLAVLKRLQDKQGRHLAALRVELRARQGLGDWLGVLKLVPVLVKREALMPEAAREIRREAHFAIIQQRADDAASLTDYLKHLSREDRRPRLILQAVRAFAVLNADNLVQKWVESVFDEAEDDSTISSEVTAELIMYYASLREGEPMSRIARAEKWLINRRTDASLLLALGRMCEQQELWGKAQSYLEASLSQNNSAAAHLELARLFDLLERKDDANRHYRAVALCAAQTPAGNLKTPSSATATLVSLPATIS